METNTNMAYINIINHVFLPRKLPDELEATDLHQTELDLLKLMAQTIESEIAIPSVVKQLFTEMKRLHGDKIKDKTFQPKVISEQLKNMKKGEMMGIYIRKQNCGLFIRMEKDGEVTLSTFAASLPNEVIYGEGEDGKLNGDIQVDYPTRAVKVKMSTMLKSEDFANQIHSLSIKQMDRAMPKSDKAGHEHVENRNVPYPMYVSQWLVGVASDRHSVVNNEFPMISKKMRDEVILGQAELPFRRSGFYTTMKVFLQLALTIELGKERGKFLYKVVMLKVMSKICTTDESIDDDIAIQMVAKIARRMEKIRSADMEDDCLMQLRDMVLDDVGKTIRDARSKMDSTFQSIQENECRVSLLKPIPKLPLKKDSIHQIPKTLKYIQSRREDIAQGTADNTPRSRKIIRHSWENTNFPDVQSFENVSGEIDVLQLLVDVEHWIFFELDKMYRSITVDSLRRLATKYMAKAHEFYHEDCFGYSRMSLAMLKIIQIMDRIAVEEHKLLRDHSSSINPQIIENLLLQSQFHLQIALKLQIYFEDRNANAEYPGLLEEIKANDNSFSVRFAKDNDEMQKLRVKILEMADSKIEEKRKEWQKARDDVACMRNRYLAKSCDYHTDHWGDRVHYYWSCQKCSLEREINAYEVDIYERPLKPEMHNQNAVVFELLMPPKIECLRDVLHLFVSKHCEPELGQIETFGKWTEYEQISQFARSKPENVFLGSTAKSLKQSHYGKGNHPDKDFSEFVFGSGYNCRYYAGEGIDLPENMCEQTVKKFVTFSVDSSSVYSGLQWTLEGTAHTQNAVLTKQFECSQGLSLKEFVNFGSLRADGHRLQLRNLYRVIETEALSFEMESVLALVMQTLWEAGPLDAARLQWNRESHKDFSDGVFAMEMIEMLETYVNQQVSNWKHPLKLIVAVTIATRVFEINNDEENAERVVKLLIQIREIVIGWISQIVETIGRCPDEASRAIVYANLVEAAICGIFTYFVSRHHPFFNKIFSNGPEHSSLYAWLHFAVTINNNILLRGNQYSGIKRILSRMVYNIGLNAEAKIRSIIENNRDEVYEFVRSQWSESRTQTFGAIDHNNESPQIIFMAVRQGKYCNYVQIDIVTGEFLVNNLPVARLPKEITNHNLFVRVFGETIFEVQQPKCSFSTVYQYNGFNYIFEVGNDSLIITEQRPNDSDRELIPPENLTGEIPYLLVENYSHWWDSARHVIEFRPKTFESKDFSTQDGVEYELDLNTRQLMHLKTRKLLLDIRSDSYKRIVEFLSRLEHQNYIHVHMDEPAKAKVHLMRMNLHFIIDCAKANSTGTYDVQSNEYCGMHVSLDQALGTLIGFRNGLFLESSDSKSKLFIVPHGTVSLERGDRHVSVHIDLIDAPLRSPTFFIFQFDNECKYIKANNFPGWFYLAHLHSVTSYSLPDPFTGMTGTERALQILQSARVWSPSPYDDESVATLRLIAALTPARTFYPPHLKVIQRIQWPDAISAVAAQDSYLLIVNKLLSYSQLLPQLYFQKEKYEIETQTILPLNERALERHLSHSPKCNISETFISPRNTTTRCEATDDEYVSNVRQLSANYVENTFVIPGNVQNYIYQLLAGEKQESLEGVSLKKIEDVIEFCHSTDLANLWIRLYELARLGRITRELFQLILSFLAFEGKDMNHIVILRAIAANAQEFKDIHAPEMQQFRNTFRHQFEREKVGGIIRNIDTKIGLAEFLESKLRYWGSESFKSRKIDFEKEYRNEVSTAMEEVTEQIERMWPCHEVGQISIPSPKLNVNESIQKINSLLRMWNDNRQLVEFIRKVESKLEKLRGIQEFVPFSPDRWSLFNAGEKPFPKYQINFDDKLSRGFQLSTVSVTASIERARQIFVEKKKTENDEQMLAEWWQIFRDFSIPANEMHLVHAGLYPHLVPSTVLPMLLRSICEHQMLVIGALAVLTTRKQRTNRIIRFEQQPQMELILRRERENQPHENWNPHERPEWLLFEIEMDLSIRRIQVEIAERMIAPPGNQHSVMQLNMGEGKTAVIVPLLAAVLADGKQLCSVTVLKSLFQTNLRSLRQCLGGMLNRRIYTFPCRRDMQIEAVADELLSIYEECMRERGVVITLPEYRLSFQLKIYEAARNGKTEQATHFLNVHKWLNRNARHILDESDAILDAKYQLIYTVGAQLPPDGGALRWAVIGAALKRVPYHMRRLFQTHGEHNIEFNEKYQIGGVVYGHGEIANRPEVFRPCRLLNESIYNELVDGLIDDFLNGELNIVFPEMLPNICRDIRNVLNPNVNIGSEDHHNIMSHLEGAPRHIIFILSGLLKFDVLKISLIKRYRVNYGVNPTGTRKMAVPFRAKDVAAEMTEFGHPDVAICLTYLSYYYSGLSDEQLYETFNVLALEDNRTGIYDEWKQSIPPELVSESVESYNGINLFDPSQRDTMLFPLLRYNMNVIDYWLSKKVFPREVKIFEGKLMCTAWDLCTEHLERVCAGFSGTNDTKVLLPLPIIQQDLTELEATNENVRQILLRDENDHYRRLPSNVSGREILDNLVSDDIPVLLDSGAMMLELNNEQVAREWLKLVPIEGYDAAIYFSKDDILLTIDRNEFITEFEHSVYRERLGRCLVYLDDVHTRGTDLKFPSGIRACVTLSGGITRDKTVQACMRMRMLGQGHTIMFYASLEADVGIRELNENNNYEPISTSHVVRYICNNSDKFGRESLVHWSAAGLNYTQKMAAHKCFEGSMALNELSDRCTDRENTPLSEMYGPKQKLELTIIHQNSFNNLALIYNEQERQHIFDWINGIRDGVVAKLPEKKIYTHSLDEEQEKELEHELEEHREVSRPPPMNPITPHFNRLLRELIIHGRSHESFTELQLNKEIRPLPMALAHATLFDFIEPQLHAWDGNIFVTVDFSSVAELTANDHDDEFLRPVWWIARINDRNNNDGALLLLSPFECNALLPTFRSSKTSVLHMFYPKLSLAQSDLLNNRNLQLPANSPIEGIALVQTVQLSMFAGSVYFNDRHEEIAYCNFMGFIPRPRSEEHQQAFEEGAIMSNGYVPIEHRHRFVESVGECQFTVNPDRIAIGIIERRHGYLSAKSHIGALLPEGKRARWNNN